MSGCRRLRDLDERDEDAWLNQMADEAELEAEAAPGSISLEEMTALCERHT